MRKKALIMIISSVLLCFLVIILTAHYYLFNYAAVYDLNGDKVISSGILSDYEIHNGICLVRNGFKVKLYNLEKNQSSRIYSKMQFSTKNRYIGEHNGKYEILDSGLNIVFSTDQEKVLDSKGEIYSFCIGKSLVGIKNFDKEIVLPPRYERIFMADGDYLLLKNGLDFTSYNIRSNEVGQTFKIDNFSLFFLQGTIYFDGNFLIFMDTEAGLTKLVSLESGFSVYCPIFGVQRFHHNQYGLINIINGVSDGRRSLFCLDSNGVVLLRTRHPKEILEFLYGSESRLFDIGDYSISTIYNNGLLLRDHEDNFLLYDFGSRRIIETIDFQNFYYVNGQYVTLIDYNKNMIFYSLASGEQFSVKNVALSTLSESGYYSGKKYIKMGLGYFYHLE